MEDKMDIKILKYFLTIAQEGTITKAAEKLCIAQPPLSRQLQQLEEELGVKLFIRGKRQIRLTDEGLFLKQQAEEIISLVNKTENQLSRIQSYTHGIISIGATETGGTGILSEMVSAFHKKYPYIRYNIWCNNADEINEKLDKGLLDIGIVREPFNTENYESIFLKSERWIVLLSKNNPLACSTDDAITLSQLSDQPLIIPSRLSLQNEIGSWFNETAQQKNILCYYNILSCILPLVEADTGIAICPESVHHFTSADKFAYRRLVNPEHYSNLIAVRKKHQLLPAATDCFWNFIQNSMVEAKK
jgi:DNA-binding transcriptional LysR family regulator